MSLPRLQLPHGVRVVRADTIDAPIEAMRSEGMGRAAWEPQYLAVAEQDEEERRRGRAAPAARADQRDEALQGRRHRPRPLRLRPDRRGLLAADRHRRPGDPSRRLPPQRGGGRRAGRACRRRWRPVPTPTAPSPGRSAASRWAASARPRSRASATTCWPCARCSRATGPVGASLPMRAAALIADESLDRIEAARAGRAGAELERALMNGALAGRAAVRARGLGRGRRAPRSCARPRSASSATTSAPPPTRP